MFLYMSVILSTGRGSLYDVTFCLAAWSMFLLGGSVSGTMFLPVEGGSLSGRSPLRDAPLHRDPFPHDGKWAVHILLECVLVKK